MSTKLRALILAAAMTLGTLAAFTGSASAALPPPETGYGSYQKTYFLTSIPQYSVEQVAIEIRNNFDNYFTFPGCGQTLDLGEVCQLQSPVGPAPVEVIAVEDTGFALKSLPGHPEGQDRTITFRFLAIGLDVDPNAKTMRVNAWGPVSAGSTLGPINDVAVAGPAWQTFADNITSRFPASPPCGPGCV